MISAGQADKIAAPKFAIDGASENPPARLLILPWGESSYDGGTAKLVVDGRSLVLIPEAQRNSNFDKLALDFNHNSIPGSESYTGEPVKVAAYGVLEIVPNDGIYLAKLEWTADGEKAWRGGYYRDISPAVLSDRHGVVYFVHSAALCRNGRIPGLEVFSADFLKPKTKATMDKYKQMVCRLLGVAEDTDDATIESAFERAVSEVGKKTDGVKNAETEKQLETFSARLDGISAAVDALSKRADEAARALIRKIPNAAGDAMGNGENLVLVVSAKNESLAKRILEAENNEKGASNVNRGAAKVLVWSAIDLKNEDAWFLVELGAVAKPFVVQRETQTQLIACDDLEDATVMKTHRFTYQAYKRAGYGYALPQYAVGSDGSADAL